MYRLSDYYMIVMALQDGNDMEPANCNQKHTKLGTISMHITSEGCTNPRVVGALGGQASTHTQPSMGKGVTPMRVTHTHAFPYERLGGSREDN